MKKKALGYVLIPAIVALAVLAIVFRLDLFILNMIKGWDENLACVFSASFQSMTNVVGITPTKLYCPRQHITIVLTKKDAEEMEEKNKEEKYFFIDDPIPKQKLEKYILKWYDEHWKSLPDTSPDKTKPIDSEYFTGKDKKGLYEYRMNEVIANAMKSCWTQLGRGELDLFSSFGNPIKYAPDTFKGNRFQDIIGAINPGNIELKLRRGRCVVCSRIIFDDRVQKIFNAEGEITSLPRWTQVHPLSIISKKPISYYEFLLDESIPKNFFQRSGDKRYYYSTNTPYIVVFERIGIIAPFGTLKKIWHFIESHTVGEKDKKEDETTIDIITLMPYEELYNECDTVEN